MEKKRVLLVQGMGGSWVLFPYLAYKLWLAGFKPIFYTPQFFPIGDLRPHAKAVAEKCRELYQESGQPVAVIGYSMGGLVAMGAMLWYNGAAAINTVISIGSPFQGTPVAKLVGKIFGKLYPSLYQMSPDSDVLKDLAVLLPPGKKLYCFGGEYDMLAWGTKNAHHPSASGNYVISATHLLLPFVVADEIVKLLGNP